MRVAQIILALCILVVLSWLAYDRMFGETSVRRIAGAVKTDWQATELRSWAVRLGCEAEVGPIVSGERVKPIVERLVNCAEWRLLTCKR